jgi:hypothetical protein
VGGSAVYAPNIEQYFLPTQLKNKETPLCTFSEISAKNSVIVILEMPFFSAGNLNSHRNYFYRHDLQ